MTEYIQIAGFWTPGPVELIVILVVALLIFGRRLPEIARSLGKSLTEFKKGINEVKESGDELADDARKFKNDIDKQSDKAAQKNSEEKNTTENS